MWVLSHYLIFFFFLLSLIDIIPHKSIWHRKIIIPILKQKDKTPAVTCTVDVGYLWMHQNINLFSGVPILISYDDLSTSVSIFFPLTAAVQFQRRIFVFQLHVFNYESLSQKKNKVIILPCEFAECLSGYTYTNENNVWEYK